MGRKIKLNIYCSYGINIGVRRLRNIVFVLAALLWWPASVHCQLETVPGFEFLSCETDSSTSHGTSDDCDNCCAVEKAQYRIDNAKLSIPTPQLLPVLFVSIIDTEPALPEETCCGLLTAAPPDLPKSWNFRSRTALPVRAPSFVS